MSAEAKTTPSPEPTFWHQLLSHPKLHLAEYVISSLLFVPVGYLLAGFSLVGWVITISAVLGLFPTLSFVMEELDLCKRIQHDLNHPSNHVFYRWRMVVDGKDYGRYTTLEKNQARLSVVVNPFYVLSRLLKT